MKIKASHWSSYRYGNERAPRKRQPILPPVAFAGAVSQTAEILRQSKITPFEFEGTCRHALRSEFCLTGNGWQNADDEAATIVAQALSSLGAKRPTWEQGQKEYAAATDSCLNCLGPLDADEIVRGRKFCCGDCAKAFIERKGQSREVMMQPMMQKAKRVAKVLSRPAKICECCGETYHPSSYDDRSAEEQRYCSTKCRDEGRRTIQERPCATCGTLFRPKWTGIPGVYCSKRCHDLSPRPSKQATCQYCGGEFTTKRSGDLAKFCGSACTNAAKIERQGRYPRDLKRHVFDHFFTKPFNESWANQEAA